MDFINVLTPWRQIHTRPTFWGNDNNCYLIIPSGTMDMSPGRRKTNLYTSKTRIVGKRQSQVNVCIISCINWSRFLY